MATGITLATTFPASWSTSQSEQFFSGASRGRTPHFRFYVSRPDGVTWTDLTDYLTFADVELGKLTRYGQTAGVDQVIRQAEFELAHDRQLYPVWDADTVTRDSEAVVGNDTDEIGDAEATAALWINLVFDTTNDWLGDSFHPKDRRSAWNQFDGSYQPLLFSRRECYFEVAMSEIGETPSEFDYVRLFEGVIGDSIANVGSGSVRMRVRDKAKYLTESYIYTVREYGSSSGTAVEDVISDILIDNGWSDIAADLWVPISPGWIVYKHKVQYMSVWDAIQNEIAPTGWFLGFRYRPSAGKMVLTLLEPPRNKTSSSADFQLTADDDIVVQDLDITDVDVRNAVEITYRDSSTGEITTLQGYDTTASSYRSQLRDQDSIDTYGLHVIPLTEDEVLGLIRTEADALAFGARLISDLKDQRGTTRIECRAMPSMDIFDGVTVDDDRISSTVDFYGAESVRHTFDMKGTRHRYRTSFIGSNQVIGGHSKWLEMESRPGAKAPIRPENVIGGGHVILQPTGVSARGIIRGIAIDVPVPDVNANRWKETEIHLSDTDGFTPSSSTRVDGGRKTHFEMTDDGSTALVSGTTYYLKVYYVDINGDKSTVSAQVSATAGQVATGDIEDNSVNNSKITSDALFIVTGNFGGDDSIGAGAVERVQQMLVTIPAGKQFVLKRARYFSTGGINQRVRVYMDTGASFTQKWESASEAGEENPDAVIYDNSGSGSNYSPNGGFYVAFYNGDASATTIQRHSSWWLEFVIE